MRARRTWQVLLLTMTIAACGGGGGGGNGNQGGAVATPTPVNTPTVSATNLVVTLRVTGDVAAASFTVGYDRAKGTFSGSGAQTQCRLGSNDTLAVNDDDNGTLRVAIIPADPAQRATLALPTDLTCSFDVVQGTIRASDLAVTAKKIGVVDQASGAVVAGDASRLDVR
jgi:hypothetical protein